jgi:hypothetical protein
VSARNGLSVAIPRVIDWPSVRRDRRISVAGMRDGVVMSIRREWVGWTALVIGAATVAASILVSSTQAGRGLTLGFGVLTALFGLCSVLARNPQPDHWGLLVVGLVLCMLPWIAGFAGDGAAWTAWLAGYIVMPLGGVAWVRDKAANPGRPS